MGEYYQVRKEWHFDSCACGLEIDWNVDRILGAKSLNGYIVQNFSRRQFHPGNPGIKELEDIDYFEAWKVKEGKIDYGDAQANDCDDCFCVGFPCGEPECVLGNFKQSLDTKGTFEFNGTVYWIPEFSELYEIVDGWNCKEIKDTNGLKGAYLFPEISNIDCVFKRNPFIHNWDLVGEDTIYKKLVSTLFRQCNQEMKKKDLEFLQSAVQNVLEAKHENIIKKVVDECKNKWRM